MRKKHLRARVVSATRSANQVRAKVIDVAPGKATVRIAGRGAVLTMLTVIGGSVSVDQTVLVDYSGSAPLVKAVI
jgi:hypothetical protein